MLRALLSRAAWLTELVHQVDDRGISLRFPRFIRVRDDKAADDATEPSQVCQFLPLWVSMEADQYFRLLRCMSDSHWPKVDQERRKVVQRTTFGNFSYGSTVKLCLV